MLTGDLAVKPQIPTVNLLLLFLGNGQYNQFNWKLIYRSRAF